MGAAFGGWRLLVWGGRAGAFPTTPWTCLSPHIMLGMSAFQQLRAYHTMHGPLAAAWKSGDVQLSLLLPSNRSCMGAWPTHLRYCC